MVAICYSHATQSRISNLEIGKLPRSKALVYVPKSKEKNIILAQREKRN